MSDLSSQTILYVLAAVIVGAVIGWLIRSLRTRRSHERLEGKWRSRFDDAAQQRDKFGAENRSLKSSLEAERSLVTQLKRVAAGAQTENQSLVEKTTMLSRNLSAVSAERNELNDRLSTSNKTVQDAKQRLAEMQEEFKKIQAFYKAQLAGSFEERKLLERKVDSLRTEHVSLTNLLTSTKSEYDAVSRLLETAEARLETLDALEKQVVTLEADNAQLRHDSTLAVKEIESLQRDVAELDALKVQNRELAHCLKSMETSRKQYESDAQRYRTQYQQSEKESETLRLRLGDIEKNFTKMQRSHKEAPKTNGEDSPVPPFGLKEPDGEMDDLTEIVGIGKVFEATLHELGVFHFRQIASFGPAEIARINAELKEFKGRIEHDDWIGQAKELHFKKYGTSCA